MNKYYAMEEELLERWKNRLRENDSKSDFVPDGMLYRGEINYVSNHDSTGYWTRARGNEASQWDAAAKPEDRKISIRG